MTRIAEILERRCCTYTMQWEQLWKDVDWLLGQVVALTTEVERLRGESAHWADATGHLFRCAKVNELWSCAKGCPALLLATRAAQIATLTASRLQLAKVVLLFRDEVSSDALRATVAEAHRIVQEER